MLKLFFVMGCLMGIVLLIIWAFYRLQDRTKKNDTKTLEVLENNLAELKKQSALLEKLQLKKEEITVEKK